MMEPLGTRSEVEKCKAERIARSAFGVFAVETDSTSEARTVPRVALRL